MERFATNKNGNIDSGTEVLANNITFLQQAKELAISNLFGDLFVEGIVNTGDSETMFPLSANVDGTFNVGAGVAYKKNVAVEPMIYERIAIENANEEYNATNPTQTTFDGVDQNIPTPKSTGCKNIIIPQDETLYYVDLRYLCVCDNGNTGDGLGLTNYSIAKNQVSTSTDQRKRFYKWTNGYEIVLVETTGDIQGICLGTVIKSGTSITISNMNRADNLLIDSKVIMDYFTSGKGIVIETNTTTNQTTLSVNVDDITTEIGDDNQVRVTKDGLYPYTKFAINSGPTTFLTNPQGNMVAIAIASGVSPLWINPSYNDRYAITSQDTIVSLNVQTEVQTKFNGDAGFYTICVNNTDIENDNAFLSTPKLEIMKEVSAGMNTTLVTAQYNIFLDLSIAPYQAKWYNGSTWKEYHGVPIGIAQVDIGGTLIAVKQFDFNRDYSQWGEVGKIMPYVGGVLPPKYLLCDGASNYSPLLYNDLYRKIGIKFGGTAGSSFAVPDFTNRVIWGGNSIDTFSYIAAGLPNIKGYVYPISGDTSHHTVVATGAISVSYPGGNRTNSEGSSSELGLTFNANNGAVQSGIYKDDCYTVQPPAVKIPILIRYTI